jgi:hypothetical protein
MGGGGGGRSSNTTTTTSTTNTTTNVGDIGFTGQNAIDLARVVSQASIEGTAQLNAQSAWVQQSAFLTIQRAYETLNTERTPPTVIVQAAGSPQDANQAAGGSGTPGGSETSPVVFLVAAAGLLVALGSGG